MGKMPWKQNLMQEDLVKLNKGLQSEWEVPRKTLRGKTFEKV